MQRSCLRTKEELSQIYYRHIKTVYRICFMFMRNVHDTDDMVQNTFCRLMNDPIQFKSEEHEKAWLIKTATNLCRDHFRHWWTKTVSIHDNDDIDETIVAIENSFIDETLEKVMNLPSKYKVVLYMFYYEGYSAVDIAKILNKNESTIRGYLFAGRKLLKIQIEGELK